MVIGPSTMTLATALPEIVPNSAEDTHETLPGPPAVAPVRLMAKSMNNCPVPVRSMNDAEQHEDHHVGGRHRQRNSENAFRRHVELIEHVLRLEPRDNERVEQKHDRGDRQRQADDPARCLEHKHGQAARPSIMSDQLRSST